MKETTDFITASEIGIYKTCPKAWSFHKSQVPQRNHTELLAGVEYHRTVGEHTLILKKAKRMVSSLIVVTLIILAVLIFFEVTN